MVPNGGGKLDGGEEIVGALVVSGCDGTEMLEVEALHEGSVAVEFCSGRQGS
jgi:hypothetical protein